MKDKKDKMIDVLYSAINSLLDAKAEKKINGKTPNYTNLNFFAWQEAEQAEDAYQDYKRGKKQIKKDKLNPFRSTDIDAATSATYAATSEKWR